MSSFILLCLSIGRLDVTPWDVKIPRLLMRNQVHATRITFDWLFDPSQVQELILFKVEIVDSYGGVIREVHSTLPSPSTTMQFVPKEGTEYYLRCAVIPKIGKQCDFSLEGVHVESLVSDFAEVDYLNSGKKRIHDEMSISRDLIWTS